MVEQQQVVARGPRIADRDVAIVGGGLAGLTAAFWLARAGRNVTVYESRPLLGGKARSFSGPMQKRPIHPYDPSADLSDFNPTVDKGYHIFPDWYWELWQLVDHVGAQGNFFPRKKIKGQKSVEAGDYALFMPPLEDLSFEGDPRDAAARSRVANEKSLIPKDKWKLWEWGPPLSMALTSMGLVASSGRTVEEMTVPDFISTRWYNGAERASVLQDLIVKALANPSRHTSAYTMRQMFRRWIPTLTTGNPWTPANGPLQTCLIDPIIAGCRDLGVVFEHAELTAIRRNVDWLTHLEFVQPAGESDTAGESGEAVDNGSDPAITTVDVHDLDVVLALPPDVLLEIAKDDVHMATLRPLSRMTQLRTAPMGALDLYFVDPDSVDGYPEHLRPETFTNRHFSLIESEFGLTGFPISGVDGWADHLDGAPGLVLQFVAGNVLDVHHFPDEEFARLLIDEIAEYLGFDPEKHLFACVPLPSSDEQLTMNDAGTWGSRPPANIPEIENMYLAGDFVKLSVDVAGMEAAVESGANAARSVLLTEEIRGIGTGIVAATGRARLLSMDQLGTCHAKVEALCPTPAGLPSRWHKLLMYPMLRAIFAVVGHTVGWFVVVAKTPLHVGTDLVSGLHDRYESHRANLVQTKDSGDRTPWGDSVGIVVGSLPHTAQPEPRGLTISTPRHDRRRGFGDRMAKTDRVLIGAGLAATVLGFVSAFVLATRIGGYSHMDDAISELGRHDLTRWWYVAATAFGWVGLQLFAAVVRKFMPGSQVLAWGLAWLGFLWLVVGLSPICPPAGVGLDGTACPSGWASLWESIHKVAALGMVALLMAFPAFTWRQVLVRLPRGYEMDWGPFRRFSAVMSAFTVATGTWFLLSLFGVGGPAGLTQRVHWAVGHVWIVALAGFLLLRRHQRFDDDGVQVGEGPLRSVDQRSLWA